MIQEVFTRYAFLGEVALVIAFAAFMGILLHLFLERRSPRWKHDAALPLEEAPTVEHEKEEAVR